MNGNGNNNFNQNQNLNNSASSGVNSALQNGITSNVNAVGGVSSNYGSNNIISWEVGQKSNKKNNINEEPEQLIEQVNGVVYEGEQPEILDDAFLGLGNTSNVPLNNNVQVDKQPVVVQQNVGVQQPIGVQQPSPKVNESIVTNNAVPIDENILSNQPLSVASLGANIDFDNQAKDVIEENKFLDFAGVDEIKKNEQDINNQHAISQKNKVNNMGILLDDPVEIIDENSLVKYYVGKNYNKINMAPFSFAAFFFNISYLFYRKLYLIGLIVYFIALFEVFVILPISFYLYCGVFIVSEIILALIVNPLYLMIVKLRVKKIVKNNKKKNIVQLNTICSKKGGTSFVKALIMSFVISTISSIIFNIFDLNSILENVEVPFNTPSIVENNESGGLYKIESYDVNSNLNITIPEYFEIDNSDYFSYVYTTSGIGEHNTCSFSIVSLPDYDDSAAFISALALYYDKSDNVGNMTANGISWDTLTIEMDDYVEYLRSTKINNDVILFSFLKGIDSTSGVCDNYFVEIIDSINIKEE